MEELVICKICKKVFTDMNQLNRHKMATHPTSIHENNGTGQFRNGSLSITRISKETSGPPISGMFRKQPATSINQRRAEMKQRGEQARVKAPFKSPDARIKGAQASLKQMVMGRQQEVDDTTTDWQKWEPPVTKDRPLPSTSRGQLTPSAIEMAVSAVPVGGVNSRKTVPPLLPMSRTKPAPPPTRPGSSAVADIMKNLGKMKSLNRQPPSRPPQKLISLPKPTQPKAKPPAAVKKAPTPKKSNPPQPQKRALPPPEDEDSSSEPELSAPSPPKKAAPPPKPSPPVAKTKPGKGVNDKLKKLKAYLPVMPGTDYEMPKLSAIGSYTNRLGQSVWVCLVCNEREQDESSQDMICCDWCEDWYHFDCVGIPTGDGAMKEDDPWYCKRCIYNTSQNPKKDFPKLFKNDLVD